MLEKTSATLTVQKWGNSLAVRIPANIARSIHLEPGTQVKMNVPDNNSIVFKSISNRKLTLNERLAIFDPSIHGGEVMASKLVGVEKL